MNFNKLQSFKFCFLLEQGFSHLSLALMLETLKQANDFLPEKLYSYVLVFDDSHLSDSKIVYQNEAVKPLSVLAQGEGFDLIVVLGGNQHQQQTSQGPDAFIRHHYLKGAWLVALETGVHRLASLGLLKNKPVSCHSNYLKDLSEQYPRLQFNTNIFSFSHGIYTCAGGLATADMMLDLIDRITPVISQRLYAQLVVDKPRTGDASQKGALKKQFSGLGKSLINAIELMESNLSEPLEMQEIAFHSGVSTRQLERLFQKHLANSPKKFYLQLRLKHARDKIINTSHSILDVALSCGFTAPTHFSKCYKDFFGMSPRQDRSAMFDGQNTNDWIDRLVC